MTVTEWVSQISLLVVTNTKRVVAGHITASEAEREEEDLIIRARLELTDEQGAELLKGMLAAHQTIANHMARRGHPAPGNDSENPN
jgi:hypothetical protein